MWELGSSNFGSQRLEPNEGSNLIYYYMFGLFDNFSSFKAIFAMVVHVQASSNVTDHF